MKFDHHGALVMERDGFPGDLGDSAHETARALILGHLIEADVFEKFVSSAGFLRHPDAPAADAVGDSWREPDATSDLVFPLLMALDMHWDGDAWDLASVIRYRLKSTWTVAPGHLASPALMALVYQKYYLLLFFTVAQRWIFKIGWRWSDSNELKGKWWKLVRTKGEPSDYLNWFCSIVYLWYVDRVQVDFDADVVRNKIIEYYRDQPNSDWYVDLWNSKIDAMIYAYQMRKA
jgi:hypothetical protein